jgi:hypothetical protein
MKKAERDHISKVVSLCCIACRLTGVDDSPAEAHHIGNGTMGKRASNYEVIALCPTHHRLGGYGVAVHAGRKAFEDAFDSEQKLLEITMHLLNE